MADDYREPKKTTASQRQSGTIRQEGQFYRMMKVMRERKIVVMKNKLVSRV